MPPACCASPTLAIDSAPESIEWANGNAMSQTLQTLAIKHPRLKTLRTFWDLTRGSRRYPARADFAFKDLRQWLGHVALLDVVQRPLRFRVRLLGTRLVEFAGRDYTGEWLDECFAPDQVDDALEPYIACIKTGSPVFRISRDGSPRATKSALERLLLPCSSDQKTIDIVLAGTYVESETSDSLR